MALIALKPSQLLIDLVGALGGHWHGWTAMCRCPAHADRTPSLSLRQGASGLLVTCFAGCDRRTVLKALTTVQPLRAGDPPTGPAGGGTARVAHLWAQAREVRGSPAERYLAQRHLACALPDVRFHPRCPHGPRPRTRFRPALLIAVREGRALVALQRIFLDRSRDHELMKAALGRPGAGAWQGAPAGAVLALAEGFETAAAFTALHRLPCWATLGARRLDLIAIPSQVERLLIAGDNDAEGRQAVQNAVRGYARANRIVAPAMPPAHFKDWADVLAHRACRDRDPIATPARHEADLNDMGEGARRALTHHG